MCGIVGYLDRKSDGESCIGEAILGMLDALECRGPDSAGVALFSKPQADCFVVRVKLGGEGSASKLSRLGSMTTTGSYGRCLIPDSADPKKLTASIEALDPEFEVVSVGRELEIVKQVGSPQNLEATYGISGMRGTHGIGHTRLSTESRVDLSHSQPFWAHGFPDLAIVHNGHITNYHQLRRRYQQRGIKFYTENDSEIIAIYLGERLSEDNDLEKALRAMLHDLDGSFSCLVATANELAFVKDPYALKPLLVAETDAFVALANEEVAIRARFPGDYLVREADVKEVRVWRQ